MEPLRVSKWKKKMCWKEMAQSLCCFFNGSKDLLLFLLLSLSELSNVLLWPKMPAPLPRAPFSPPLIQSQKSDHCFIQSKFLTFRNGQDNSTPASFQMELTSSSLVSCVLPPHTSCSLQPVALLQVYCLYLNEM